MRWRMAELFELADTGRRDRLGNRVTERRSLGRVRVRTAPWGAVATESEGNGYTSCDLTLVTTAPLATVRRAALVRLPVGEGGEAYEVVQATDLGRRRAISCVRRKGATP